MKKIIIFSILISLLVLPNIAFAEQSPVKTQKVKLKFDEDNKVIYYSKGGTVELDVEGLIITSVSEVKEKQDDGSEVLNLFPKLSQLNE